jgi:hypothetical protein
MIGKNILRSLCVLVVAGIPCSSCCWSLLLLAFCSWHPCFCSVNAIAKTFFFLLTENKPRYFYITAANSCNTWFFNENKGIRQKIQFASHHNKYMHIENFKKCRIKEPAGRLAATTLLVVTAVGAVLTTLAAGRLVSWIGGESKRIPAESGRASVPDVTVGLMKTGITEIPAGSVAAVTAVRDKSFGVGMAVVVHTPREVWRGVQCSLPGVKVVSEIASGSFLLKLSSRPIAIFEYAILSLWTVSDPQTTYRQSM